MSRHQYVIECPSCKEHFQHEDDLDSCVTREYHGDYNQRPEEFVTYYCPVCGEEVDPEVDLEEEDI